MALSKRAHEILNRPDLIARRDMWINRMQDMYASRENEWNSQHLYRISGTFGSCSHDPYSEPELWVEDCLESLAERYEALEDDNYFRPLIVEYGIYGVHYTDKILGADVIRNNDQWYALRLKTPVGELERPDLDSNHVWQLTQRVINAFLEADVALPFFGVPTFASALNVAVNLYSESILMEMLAEPDSAMKDLVTINDLLCEMHSYCRSRIPAAQLQMYCCGARTQPPGFGELCGCTTQLISGELYRELIAPLDDKLLSVYPNGGMIHLCGAHTQHMQTFRDMKSLRVIHMNDRATFDLERYFNELREDQVIYIHPCKEMPLETILEITGGKRVFILHNT